MPTDLAKQALAVELVVFDVDGVFTDGRFALTASGEEIKTFHTRDGVGVKQLLRAGLQVAIITGRKAPAVEHRMADLGVTHVLQGISDKLGALTRLRRQLNIGEGAHAAMGDDVPDLAMFQHAALTVAVADAHPVLRKQADIITDLPGGMGAVREFSDYLLALRGQSPELNPVGALESERG